MDEIMQVANDGDGRVTRLLFQEQVWHPPRRKLYNQETPPGPRSSKEAATRRAVVSSHASYD